MNGVGSSAGRAFTGGSLRGRGLTGLGLSTGHLWQGVVAGLSDGTGMPGEPGRLLLADANAEASRGLAPVGAAIGTARLCGRRCLGGFGRRARPAPTGSPGCASPPPTARTRPQTARARRAPQRPPHPPTAPDSRRSARPLPQRARPDRRPGHRRDPPRPKHRPHAAVHPGPQPSGATARLPHRATPAAACCTGRRWACPQPPAPQLRAPLDATTDVRQQLQVWGNTLDQDRQAAGQHAPAARTARAAAAA